MGRLTNIKPPVAVASPTLGRVTDDHGHSAITEPWRRWYKTARWQRLRWGQLVADLFTCQRCGRTEQDTSQLTAHHKVPHRGDPVKFWNQDNLTTVCKTCHDGPIAKIEAAGGTWP